MEFTELAKEQIDALQKQKATLLSAVASLDDAIRILQGNQDRPVDWKNSALKCLFDCNHPMRTVDILNCMYNKKEPVKPSDENKRRNYVSALSIALNNLCDQGHLARLQVDKGKGYFYGIRSWFTENGELQEQFNKKLKDALQSPYSVFRFSKETMTGL